MKLENGIEIYVGQAVFNLWIKENKILISVNGAESTPHVLHLKK